MEKIVKINQDLYSVHQSLCETAYNFRSLYEEATILFDEKKDVKGYVQKLKERANLLRVLPYKLAGLLNELSLEVKEEIESKIEYFAEEAKKMLEEDNKFGLAVLLTHKGCRASDKNDLEELISYIEKELIN